MTDIHSLTPSPDDFDKLVSSPDWRTRAEVARQRQFLRHERELAAIDAALAGDDAMLDKLVSDPSEDVRIMVAKAARPQDLDILVSDPSALVRAAVARYGRPEDRQKLVSDPSPLVRAQAVRGGK